MATNFLWAGAGAYSVGRTNWLTTELNSLAASAANVLSTLGGAFQNTAGYIYVDVEVVIATGVTTTAGAFVELWLLRSLDGGSNYEDGSSTVAPGRAADIAIPVRAGSGGMRAGSSALILPPGFYKPIARNQTGVTWGSSANTITFSSYAEQY